MQERFSQKTFEYFKGAKKNYKDRDWFEKHKFEYEKYVKEPFKHLVEEINKELKRDLRRIKVSTRSISRPLRPSNKAHDLGHVKNFISIDLAEKKTSLFEWNPGIHIQLGGEREDNLIGVGLYMVSGRQIKELRKAFYNDYDEIKKILKKKIFKETWGEVLGEKYKRFPKDYEQDQDYSEFLWFKQFYISKNFTKKEVMHKNFVSSVVKDLKVSLPFLNWLRESVGNYRRIDSIR